MLKQFKKPLLIGSLLTFGSLCFCVQVVFTIAEHEAALQGDMFLTPVFGNIKALATDLTATYWTVFLVGMFERLLKTPRAIIRWLVDASYWVYVMHLAVVACFTIWLVHVDRQGRLRDPPGNSNRSRDLPVRCSVHADS